MRAQANCSALPSSITFSLSGPTGWVALLCGLRGQLVFFAWDDPEKVEPVGAAGDHDRRMVHAARAEGGRRFPTISGLAPVRDASARVCASCGGSGKLASVPENIVCECGGVGWVPW